MHWEERNRLANPSIFACQDPRNNLPTFLVARVFSNILPHKFQEEDKTAVEEGIEGSCRQGIRWREDFGREETEEGIVQDLTWDVVTIE